MTTRSVLITGAEGLVGSYLRTSLADRYTIHCTTWKPADFPSHVLDVSDLAAMTAACTGMDAVIHLAGSAMVDAPWSAVLHNNIEGTYSVFEAARRAGVRQVIYASSNHVVGTYEMEGAPTIYRTGTQLYHDTPARPDSLYGVSKGFGELLGRYYADHHGLRVICLRLGSVNAEDTPLPSNGHLNPATRWLTDPDHQHERMAALWLSQRDLTQLMIRALEADTVPFGIFYGISRNANRFHDLLYVRTILGYEPQDGAEIITTPVTATQAEDSGAE